MRILAHMCEVIQGLDFLLGFDFSAWVVAADLRILLKRVIDKVEFGSLQDFPFLTELLLWSRTIILSSSRSQDDRLVTYIMVYLNKNWKMIRATSRLCYFPWGLCWAITATERDIKNPVQNYITTRIWKLKRIPQLRMFIKVAQNNWGSDDFMSKDEKSFAE